MKKTALPLVILLLVGLALVAGCVNSGDAEYRSIVQEASVELIPLLEGQSHAFRSNDPALIVSSCRDIIQVTDKYLEKLSSLEVSEDYRLSKQYMIKGMTDYKTGSELAIEAYSTSNLNTRLSLIQAATKYIKDSVDEITLAGELLPNK